MRETLAEELLSNVPLTSSSQFLNSLSKRSKSHLDNGSSRLSCISKAVSSDRRSITSSGKRPYNVQITAKTDCDHLLRNRCRDNVM